MNKIEFTDREFQIIQDQEFLITKSKALSKVDDLLLNVRSELKLAMKECSFVHPILSSFKSSKISRGESYRGLPYLVLDYPAVFSVEDTFAFRTMFWWGNFFSTTIHLQGKSLDFYRERILEKIDLLDQQDIFICINKSPWEYHYEKDNYELLSNKHIEFIKKCSLLKLSKRVELDKWKKLPELSMYFLSLLLKVLDVH